MGARMRVIQPVIVNPETMDAAPFLVLPEPREELVVQVDEDFEVYAMHTNVPEDDYPAWNPATAYAKDAYVMWKHHIYRAAAASTGVEPGAEVRPEDDDGTWFAKWVDYGFTNRWRMFDEKIGTATTADGAIVFTITPDSPVDAIAFFGIDAAGVTVTVFDPATGVVASRQTAPVLTDGITDWYAYFFNPIELLEDFVLLDLPASRYYALEVRIEKPGGTVKAGAVVMGRTEEIGEALHGSSIGIVDYSRKERDTFGNAVILERGFSKRADFDVSVETRRIGQIQRLLARNRAKPLVWIGEQTMEATILYGYYRDFSIVISGPIASDCTISVEGLT